MNDVHPPAYAPLWKLDPSRQIYDVRIWLIKLDIEKFQDRLGEPGYIRGRTGHQFVEVFDPMLTHECSQMGALDILLCWTPDNITTKRKLFRHKTLLKLAEPDYKPNKIIFMILKSPSCL